MKLAGLLLAAGNSRRFGAADKLLAPLDGAPLVTHAANALRALAPDMLIAVTRSPDVAHCLQGFTPVQPPQTDPLQSDSLRAGVSKAMDMGADRILVTLGDMPFVTGDLLGEIAALCTDRCPSATGNGDRPMPPACFPKASFADLLALSGDQGASTLLKALPSTALVIAPAGQLFDIDRPAELLRHQNRSGANEERPSSPR